MVDNRNMSEANARIIIDKLLRESDWVLSGDDGVVNVDTEMQNQAGFADYVLKDSSDFPLCIIEAKKELVSPLVGKNKHEDMQNHSTVDSSSSPMGSRITFGILNKAVQQLLIFSHHRNNWN